jgi:LysM domain-containing protein
MRNRSRALAVLFLFVAYGFARGGHAAALDLGLAPEVVGTRFQYVIAKGDTLTSVSARFAVSEKALIADNALKTPYRPRAGDRLVVPKCALRASAC